MSRLDTPDAFDTLGGAGADSPDSVPLEALSSAGGKTPPRFSVANLKLILALFVIFVFVVSDFFTNTVIAGFGEKAVRGRGPTSWGVVLQGIFLVIGYILAIYLIEHKVL
jgi:hypothetical protein